MDQEKGGMHEILAWLKQIWLRIEQIERKLGILPSRHHKRRRRHHRRELKFQRAKAESGLKG